MRLHKHQHASAEEMSDELKLFENGFRLACMRHQQQHSETPAKT